MVSGIAGYTVCARGSYLGCVGISTYGACKSSHGLIIPYLTKEWIPSVLWLSTGYAVEWNSEVISICIDGLRAS